MSKKISLLRQYNLNNELICELVKRLNKKRMEPEPKENPDGRDAFVRNFLLTNEKKYHKIIIKCQYF